MATPKWILFSSCTFSYLKDVGSFLLKQHPYNDLILDRADSQTPLVLFIPDFISFAHFLEGYDHAILLLIN